MKLKRIQRTNIYQHGELDLEITGSRVALVGPNGSGKSNLLLSVCENLTGEFHQNKKRIVKWGAEKGVMIDTYETPDGRTFTVKREFPSGTAVFNMGEEEVIGADKVTARVLRELGVEKSILQTLIFVPQAQIDDILFARDSIKDRLAQKFFGLQSANIIEKGLSTELSSMVVDSSAAQLPVLIESRAAILGEISALESSSAGLSTVESLDETIRNFDSMIANGSNFNTRLHAYITLLSVEKSLREQYDSLVQEYRDAHAEFSKIDIATARQQLLLHQEAARKIIDIDRNESDLRSFEKSHADAVASGDPGMDGEMALLESEISSLAETIGKLKTEVDPRSNLLRKIGTSPICGTCGQPVDLSRRGPIEQELAVMEPQLKEATQNHAMLVARRSALGRKISDWKERIALTKGTLDQALKRKSELGERPNFVPEPDKWQQVVDFHANATRSLNDQHAAFTRVKVELDKAQRDIAAYGDTMKKDDGTPKSPVKIDDLQKCLQDTRLERDKVTTVTASISAARQRLAMVDAQIATARAAKAKNAAGEYIQRILSMVRAVFHPDGAPRTLVSRSVQQMEVRINAYLVMMKARFRVTSTDGLNFDCHFPNGIAKAEELSRGQKVTLAWAFRLAALETFSASVGMMSMDEPTAPMDKESNDAFLDVMEVLRDLATNYGMQFFVATHHEKLAQSCDQIIHLSHVD